MSSIEKAIARLAATSQESVSKRQILAQTASTIANEPQPERQVVSKVNKILELNFKTLERTGYLTPNTKNYKLAENYRFLKLPLLRVAGTTSKASFEENNNLIAITSANKGEGKTFTSFNLAMSIAMHRDTTVLLIDGDLIERSLTKLVGLNNALGLTDLLLDPQTHVSDVIVHTNVANLKIIPAGHTCPDTTELMASKRMQKLAIEFSKYYDNRVVLFDTPPLLKTSLAKVVTSLVGQILVVVKEGKTSPRTIQEAITLLDENKTANMVLNRCFRRSRGSYYKSH